MEELLPVKTLFWLTDIISFNAQQLLCRLYKQKRVASLWLISEFYKDVINLLQSLTNSALCVSEEIKAIKRMKHSCSRT